MSAERTPHSEFPEELEQAINALRGGPSDHDEELDAAEKMVRDELLRWSEAYGHLEEQFEALRTTAQEVETLAFRQYVDWMHFHELAMAKPFEAESEAQDFARRVSSLLTIALGDDTSIEVIDGLNPAKSPHS